MRLVALGDSFTCGEGVGVRIDPARTWTALLATALGVRVENLASPGATVDRVRREQLGRAHEHSDPEDIAAVLVGLNNVIRGSFDRVAIRDGFEEIVDQLSATHSTLLVGRWHDPFCHFALPARLRAPLADRLAHVNAAIDAAVEDAPVVVVDLGAIAALQSRHAWAVDRVHPSEAGHRAIARAALRGLACADLDDPAGDTGDAGASRWDEGRWLVRHGAPWLVRRLREVAMPVVGLAISDLDGLGEPGAGGRVTGSEQFVGQ